MASEAYRCSHLDCRGAAGAFETAAQLAAHTRSEHPVSFTATCELGQCELPVVPTPDTFDRSRDLWSRLEAGFAAMNASSPEEFVLHDGPPYANGHLHLGHALNKVLKDALCKRKRLEGKRCVLRPGWDCHGLPVELAVCKHLRNQAAEVSLEDLRRQCQLYAKGWVDTQMEELRAMGVLADYGARYLTMDPAYEASTLRAFGHFVERGLVHRMRKTVPWCVECHTSLATAEMEYQARRSPTVFVSFPLAGGAASDLVASLSLPATAQLSLCVYTTTPWTLPLNRAVAVRPGEEYVVLDGGSHGFLVVAASLEQEVCAQLRVEHRPGTARRAAAEALAACEAVHPWELERHVPVVADTMVSAHKGTGCVHLAPGCGPEDYAAGVAHGLEVYCPVSPKGVFTSDAPAGLPGMPVAAAATVVRNSLEKQGRLLFSGTVEHDYPHCWRCHKPLLFRATEQYFCDLARLGLAEAAAEEVGRVEFFPEEVAESSAAKLRRYVCGRADWCLSRSRAWGVPVPACLCASCGHVELSREAAEAAAGHVESVGVVGWGQSSPVELLGRGCCKCGSEDLSWETDVLDVWFDSGVSHSAVLGGRPADLYFEGDDQYRGWFQASLLTSMVLQKAAPTRAFATHSFVVDEKGHKMSKSAGNVVGPLELHRCYPAVLPQYNPDVLRLWALSADYTKNVRMSEKVVRGAAAMCSKFRMTFRFLLQNLGDFDPQADAVPFEDLGLLERLALLALDDVEAQVAAAFAALDVAEACSVLDAFCREQLSKKFNNASKATLYFLARSDPRRRACQTALWQVLRSLLTALSPLTSFLCEEVWRCLPEALRWEAVPSVHLVRLPDAGSRSQWLRQTPRLRETAAVLEHLRLAVLAAVDQVQRRGSLQKTDKAEVTMLLPHWTLDALSAVAPSEEVCHVLRSYCGVAACAVDAADCGQSKDPKVHVAQTACSKCARCWQYVVAPRETDEEDLSLALAGDLCGPCAALVGTRLEGLLSLECSCCGKHGHTGVDCPRNRKVEKRWGKPRRVAGGA